MPPRITKTTATAFFDCFTTRSKAAISARAKRTSTGSPKSAISSSINAPSRACRSRASMAGCLPIVPSVARRFHGRFTPAAKPASNFLLGAYQALCRQIALGTVEMFPQTEMLDLVMVDGHAKGIITRNLCTGEIEAFAGDAVVLATGGYGNVFFLSTNARGCNVTATYRAYKRGALFANPCFTQIHPTCIPVTGRSSIQTDFDV